MTRIEGWIGVKVLGWIGVKEARIVNLGK